MSRDTLKMIVNSEEEVTGGLDENYCLKKKIHGVYCFPLLGGSLQENLLGLVCSPRNQFRRQGMSAQLVPQAALGLWRTCKEKHEFSDFGY